MVLSFIPGKGVADYDLKITSFQLLLKGVN
jgi:hypothetical protein